MKRIKIHKAYFITWLFILYIVYANHELLGTFFMATVIFSTAIVGFLTVGTLYQFVSGFQIMMLGGTFGALAYKRTGYEFYIRSINTILPANIAHMLQARKTQQEMLFTEDESRDIIDWLESKFVKTKAYINFFINTSMLIGLLGTFVGLVESIDKMGQIILSMNGDNIDIKEIMQQFAQPLSGMAIGFGASLFGVVTAVILGLNGYILFRYQDTLISGIEEWLKDRIVDVNINHNGGSDAISSSDVLGHRKTFMDVFLEQMSTLTKEIQNFSYVNENFSKMSKSLISIETSLSLQTEFFKDMLMVQEKNSLQLGNFSSSFIDMQTVMEKNVQDNKLALKENHNELELLNQNIQGTNINLQNSEVVLKTILSLNEKVLHQSHEMHVESLESMNSIANIMQYQREGIQSVQEKIESGSGEVIKNQKNILMIFENFIQSMSNTNISLQNSEEFLKSILSLNEKASQSSGEMHSQTIQTMNSMTNMMQSQKEEIQTVQEKIEDGNSEQIKNQQEMLLAFRQLSQALNNSNEKVLDMQNKIHFDNTSESNKLLGEIVKMQEILQSNQYSVDKMIDIHTDGYRKENSFQEETIHFFSDGMKFAETMQEQLKSIEEKIASYLEMIHLQNEQNKKSAYKHSDEILDISTKLENTAHEIETNGASLEKLEKMVSKIESRQVHHKDHKNKDKSFFASWFNKK